MSISVDQALAGAQSKFLNSGAVAAQRMVIAGATGVLGNAVLRRLVGMQRASHTSVLAREPIGAGMRHVSAHVVMGEIAQWNVPGAAHARSAGPWDVALVMLDPPRMFYDRERALWTPTPEQLPALAAWLKRCGVHTLALVLPHAQGTLPEALKRGLASLDEHALAAVGFERLLIVRTAEKPKALQHRTATDKLAAWMLGIASLMVPASEQPVRATKVAELVDMALQHLPLGTWVAAPELVWRAAQGDAAQMRAVLKDWLGNHA